MKLFGQGKENEYDDDVTVVRGPPGPPGIDGNLLKHFSFSYTYIPVSVAILGHKCFRGGIIATYMNISF